MNHLQSTSTPILTLSGIVKMFGPQRAVDGLSVEIQRGEIFSLLGPSGCGKSTTLRIIAGLEQPDAGTIALNDTVLVSAAKGIFVPSQKRNMGMVFQSYAIWPHLTVFETVAYPLAVRKVPKATIAEKVDSILRLVDLDGYQTRLAPTLSGGQQQRVALARALVYEPDVLLLDEPFSNLDVKLREQMRVELKVLQRRVGVTVILVTHDQMEALSLSDRIAVMNAGRIEQLGSPFDLYESPHTPFVRDFIGQSFQLSGSVVAVDDSNATVALDGGGRLHGRFHNGTVFKAGDKVTASARPESFIANAASAGPSANALDAVIKALLFVGDKYECVLQIGTQEVRSFLPRPRGHASYREGMQVKLALSVDDVTIWPR
jgi:ABC-type Fe3+/spermidine/putrescine transport system ATPase subunit